MARERRYELYEGNGETIPGERTEPYTASVRVSVSKNASTNGSDEDQWEMIPEEPETKQRYFARSEYNDGLGPPSALFDDFDRFNGNRVQSTRYVSPKKKKKKNQGAWTAVSVVCLILLAGMGMLMLPQLAGVRHRLFPNYAFANGSIIELSPEKEEQLNKEREQVNYYSDKIRSNVYIDGIDVGGMTWDEAFRAVEDANEKIDTDYDLTVTVGNESWHINNERLPIARNTRDIVDQAWAVGRSDVETFRERKEQVSDAYAQSHPAYFFTEPSYDHQKLKETVQGIAAYISDNCKPENSKISSFDPNTKQFTFTEDKPGAKLDADALYARLESVMEDILRGGATHLTVRAEAERVEARYTKAELMNRCGMISTFYTDTTKNNNRNTNIELSARAINGKAVQPGEIFSFNDATGERTAAKGYKEAAAISGGQTKDEIGGGVCQTSSTLFNAVARADLEIVERSPHAWPSSYIDKGLDATVNWPGVDFKFRNNTEFPVFIIAGYSKLRVTVSIYGIKPDSGLEIELESRVVKTYPKPSGVKRVLNTSLAVGESKKTVSAREGYDVETWKIWKRNGVKVKEELFVKSKYKTYQETVEYNDGSQP